MNNKESKQIVSVNILRFLAAFFVMMYHYTFMFFQRGVTYLDFGFLRSFFHYGYLGVDLFFMISGFVVALSAEGRSCKEFVISRMTRLYPMLWVAVTLTTITVLFFNIFLHQEVRENSISFIQYVANLSMVPSLFHLLLIDGSYWTLSIELKFYAFIWLLLLFGMFRYIREIVLLLTSTLATFVFFFHLEPNYISYFLAGILFYSLYRKGFSIALGLALFVLMCISVKYATFFAPELTNAYHFIFSPTVIGVFIIVFYGMFFAISTKVLICKSSPFFAILGAITYPIYLLHQTIGKIFFKVTEMFHINHWFAFLSVSSGIVLLSYLLHRYYEKKAQDHLRFILGTLFSLGETFLKKIKKHVIYDGKIS